MSSSILMPNNVSERRSSNSEIAQTISTDHASTAPTATDCVATDSPPKDPVFLSNDVAQSNSVSLTEQSKLPYQADQQAEFLHLQAETEALFNHLQTLKQQRLASSSIR
jgi:hypothetical protein